MRPDMLAGSSSSDVAGGPAPEDEGEVTVRWGAGTVALLVLTVAALTSLLVQHQPGVPGTVLTVAGDDQVTLMTVGDVALSQGDEVTVETSGSVEDAVVLTVLPDETVETTTVVLRAPGFASVSSEDPLVVVRLPSRSLAAALVGR